MGLRAGSETNDDSDVKDTTRQVVGVSTLFVGNVNVNPLDAKKREVFFDFIGKDSIPYNGVLIADPIVYDFIVDAKKTRKRDERLFDIQYKDIIQQLKEFHPEMTMKSIRTYRITREFCKLSNYVMKVMPLMEDSGVKVKRLLKQEFDFVFE